MIINTPFVKRSEAKFNYEFEISFINELQFLSLGSGFQIWTDLRFR